MFVGGFGLMTSLLVPALKGNLCRSVTTCPKKVCGTNNTSKETVIWGVDEDLTTSEGDFEYKPGTFNAVEYKYNGNTQLCDIQDGTDCQANKDCEDDDTET